MLLEKTGDGENGNVYKPLLTVILHVYVGYTQELSAGNIFHSHRYDMGKFRT